MEYKLDGRPVSGKELRINLGIHTIVADKMLEDPTNWGTPAINAASSIIQQWLDGGTISEGPTRNALGLWKNLLASNDVQQVASKIVEKSADARAMRSVSPMAGDDFITQEERMIIVQQERHLRTTQSFITHIREGREKLASQGGESQGIS